MHEATIAQSILDIAVEKLNQEPEAVCVSSISVKLGEFRNVELDSLQFAFDNLKGQFPGCQNCQLKADIVLSLALCRDCGHTYHPHFEQSFRCDKCQGGMGKLLNGEELDIVAITLEAVDKELSDYARIC